MGVPNCVGDKTKNCRNERQNHGRILDYGWGDALCQPNIF